MASVTVGPFQAQNSPARYFVMDPIKGIDDFRNYRDGALGLLAGKIREKGSTPATYDVRPVSPGDDLISIQAASSYAGDWSVASGAIGSTGSSLAGAGNTIVTGTMPQDRYTVFYGTEIETPATPPEIMWKFSAGANVKSVWFLQELLGFEFPRAVTRQAPVWGPSETFTHVLYAVAAQPVVDAHLTLWAEPTGITITASTLRA